MVLGVMAQRKNNAFGERIAELQGKMTSNDLAKAIGMSRNQLYLMKTGQSGTTPETIEKLVIAFGMIDRKQIEDFYALAGFSPPDSTLASLREAREDYSLDDLNIDFLGYLGRIYASIPPGTLRDEWKRKLREDAITYAEFIKRIAEFETYPTKDEN